MPGQQRLIQMAGKRFGHWLVIKRAGFLCEHALWWCRCDCGADKHVVGARLRAGRSRSCWPCALHRPAHLAMLARGRALRWSRREKSLSVSTAQRVLHEKGSDA